MSEKVSKQVIGPEESIEIRFWGDGVQDAGVRRGRPRPRCRSTEERTQAVLELLSGKATADQVALGFGVGIRPMRFIASLLLLGWILPSCRQNFEPKPESKSGSVVLVTGTLTDEGVECQALRDDTGRLYTLVGSTAPFRGGARVCIRGRPLEVDYCQQGIAIEVVSIHPGTRCP